MRLKATFVTLTMAVLALSATLAAADPPSPGVVSPPDPTATPNAEQRAGIENARAAGITVDSRAEELMTKAPLGTCANDPTLSHCPPARAVIFSGDSGTYAPLSDAATSPELAITQASGPTDQCRVDLDPERPYTNRARTRAYAYGKNYCTSAATRQELYVYLDKYGKKQDKWVQQDTASASGTGGYTIGATASVACRTSSIRAWRATANGYGLVQGVWYAGQRGPFYDPLACNS